MGTKYHPALQSTERVGVSFSFSLATHALLLLFSHHIGGTSHLHPHQSSAACVPTKTRKRAHVIATLRSLRWRPVGLRIDFKIHLLVSEAPLMVLVQPIYQIDQIGEPTSLLVVVFNYYTRGQRTNTHGEESFLLWPTCLEMPRRKKTEGRTNYWCFELLLLFCVFNIFYLPFYLCILDCFTGSYIMFIYLFIYFDWFPYNNLVFNLWFYKKIYIKKKTPLFYNSIISSFSFSYLF